MSDYIPVDCVNLICALAPKLLDLDQEDPIPYHNSVLTGQMRFEEVMNTQNPKRFSDCCRMDKRTFTLMLYFLIDHAELVGSENICAGQRLMIYISILKGGTTALGAAGPAAGTLNGLRTFSSVISIGSSYCIGSSIRSGSSSGCFGVII